MAREIEKKSLNPYFLVHANCMDDLSQTRNTTAVADDYNSVVLGDAVEGFSYQNINQAFQLIMKTGCPLYALGKGKYYQDCGELNLDVGRYFPDYLLTYLGFFCLAR